MLTFELIQKKRNPTKVFAITGFLVGITILILTGVFSDILNNLIKYLLFGISICDLAICIFILNYSYKFRNVIGHISFFKESIELEHFQKIERIMHEDINSIRFQLNGYEGLNKSGISDMRGVSTIFSYCSGLENFVYIETNHQIRQFEFYIPNKWGWITIKQMVTYYSETINSKN